MPSTPSPPLPRLYVIGDSISLHYGPYLERLVAGRLEYARKSDESASATKPAPSLDYPRGAFGENAGDSRMLLEYLRARRRSLPADYVLLNCGLHDLKTDPAGQNHQVGIDEYRANLEAIASLLATESYRPSWVSTTPVSDATHAAHTQALGFTRRQADVERYNEVAAAVMRAAGVAIVDLHAFTLSLAADPHDSDALAALYCDHVHFVERVRQEQAAYLAAHLTALVSGARAGSAQRRSEAGTDAAPPDSQQVRDGGADISER